MQTIVACAQSYDAVSVSNYASQLWDSLKHEILGAQEDEVVDEAMQAVAAVAQCLSSGSKPPQVPHALTRYIELITTECRHQLHNPLAKQAQYVGQMLGLVASSSLSALARVVKSIMESLLFAYHDAGGLGNQRALLMIVNRLLEATMSHYGTWRSANPFPDSPNPMEDFKARLYEIFVRAFMATNKDESSFRTTALKGLVLLAQVRNFLPEDEVGMIVQHLNGVLLEEDLQGYDELKSETIQALAEIGTFKASLITDISLPAFIARLPDADGKSAAGYGLSLEVLAKLSAEESVFEVVLRRLLNKLDIILQNDPTVEYVSAILLTLLYMFGQKQLQNDPNLNYYHQKLVVGLLPRIVGPLHSSHQPSVLNEVSVLHVIGRLANTIERALSADVQFESVANAIFTLFSPGVDVRKYADSESVDCRRIIILSTYLLASIRPEVCPSRLWGWCQCLCI